MFVHWFVQCLAIGLFSGCCCLFLLLFVCFYFLFGVYCLFLLLFVCLCVVVVACFCCCLFLFFVWCPKQFVLLRSDMLRQHVVGVDQAETAASYWNAFRQ